MLTRALFALVLVAGALAGGRVFAEEIKLAGLGISDREVTQAELETGTASRAPRFNSPAVAYAWALNLKKGDIIEVALVNGDKPLLRNTETLQEDEANYLLQAGKRSVPAGGWPEGTYHAAVKITRGGKTLMEKTSEPMAFE